MNSTYGQYVIDSWVSQRQTPPALENGRVVAGAHLLHYRHDSDVGVDNREAGDIAWLIGWELVWKRLGVGSELVKRAVIWLQLAGCKRVVVPVVSYDEEAGADRFYGRYGRQTLSRQTKGWERTGLDELD